MLRRTVILRDLEGMHARNSAKIVMICQDTETMVKLVYGDRSADGGNILELMSLSARYGDEMVIEANGTREREAVERIENVLSGSMI